MARPSSLTPDKAKRISDLIAAGNDQETAAQAAGISKSTHYAWLQRGKAEKERLESLAETSEETPDVTEKEQPYLNYLESVEKAIAEAEAGLVLHIRTAAKEPRTWQAAAWLLTHGPSKHKWKGISVNEVSGPEGGPVRSETKQVSMSESEILQLADEILGLKDPSNKENEKADTE